MVLENLAYVRILLLDSSAMDLSIYSDRVPILISGRWKWNALFQAQLRLPRKELSTASCPKIVC